MYAIYSISPTPIGTDYRLVERFDTKKDAKKVLKCLESVNINFNVYEIKKLERK